MKTKKLKYDDKVSLSLIDLELIFKQGEISGLVSLAGEINVNFSARNSDAQTFDEYMLETYQI
ncbi:MAG: hypothetical protein ACTSQL_07655, partial [Promethearchaeota archaeon]